jgi:hypothetical protein
LPSLETLSTCPGALSNRFLSTGEYIGRREEINELIRKQRVKLQRHHLRQQLLFVEETMHGRPFHRAVRRSETALRVAILIREAPISIEPIREASIRMEVDSSTTNSAFFYQLLCYNIKKY